VSDISNSGRQRVSAEQRAFNSRCIEKRDRWRFRYAVVSRAIRRQKNAVSEMPNRENHILLEELQGSARALMYEREWITADLKESAYAWA
jgi:hypothetical protein